MKPLQKFVTIHNNAYKIKRFLKEVMLQPRLNILKWSKLTKQTPNIKIGYPGQHLASLITGMSGEKTGARGNDLIDGSEVKSCSRIDQLDNCTDCASPVARLEEACPSCGSTNIDRKNDSKWLFTIRSQADLDLLTKEVNRIVLILGDYPNFEEGDFGTLRFQTFEIWPGNKRHKRFSEIMSNYYHKIYLTHKKDSPTKTPAPKNFWPYQYQFYMCNPILTFSCTVFNANTKPKIEISHYTSPSKNRTSIDSIPMPVEILTEDELDLLIKKTPNSILKRSIRPAQWKRLKDPNNLSFREKQELFSEITEDLRDFLPLRDTDKISNARTTYSRRTNS